MGKKIYILLSFIGIAIFYLQKMGIYLPVIINNYANDLLCLPLVLGGISFVIRRLKKDPDFRFPLVFVILMALYYSVYFEYYLPKNNPRYTSDWVDVVLYFSSAFLFYWYENAAIFRKKTKINLK